MITDKMAAALNKQINAEWYSAYLYQSMSAYATAQGLSGAANWLSCQAKEEMTHGMKIYDYLNSVGARVVLTAIDQPPTDFESVRDVFEQTLAHEKKVTALINGLANLARDERDHATEIFLQWFVTEQVEEEENANDILSHLKLAGSEGGGLFMIDKELGTRVFTPPPAAPKA